MKHGLSFTIYHGLAASLAIHAALAAPFALPNWNADPDQQPLRLVVEFKGVTSTDQVEEKVAQETKGEETKDKVEAVKPEPAAPPQEEEKEIPVEKETDRTVPSTETIAEKPPMETKTGEAGANNVAGMTERREAQTVPAPPVTEAELKLNYARAQTKKVLANLTYPDDASDAGLKGVARVSFTVLPDGRIRPGTLKIVSSSGKRALDAAALKAVTATAPFDPPPSEMAIGVNVVRSHGK